MSAFVHKKKPNESVALAFVGSIVPDKPAFDNAGFSRAGNMFQENLLRAMRDIGFSPSLILSQRPLPALPKSSTIWAKRRRVEVADGLPVCLVPFLNLSFLRPLTVGLAVLLGLLQWGYRFRKAPYKVVLTYNLTEPAGVFTLIGSRLIGARAVAIVIDINIPGQTVPVTLPRCLDFELQKRLIPRFDGLIVISKRIVEDFAPGKPFVRVEGGVNEAVLRHFATRPRKLTGALPFTIVLAGSLDEANGCIELIEAFSLLRGDNYRLRIAGAGPLQDRVEQAAVADPRIEYLGYLTFDQVLALYDTADLLINMRLTRRLDTTYFFPSKMMEYLASGVPVITTCPGHVEEEYADIAFLLREETPQALAQIIAQVAAMPADLRIQKGLAAQAYIQAHNSWLTQGRRVVEFICHQVLHLDYMGNKIEH
ncbi:MAG: glycosyltransferase family 4 protein [Anaerolineae bacterium]|nr:glycosyltransferase family 4 protein [Anaerolineae bacterium]